MVRCVLGSSAKLSSVIINLCQIWLIIRVLLNVESSLFGRIQQQLIFRPLAHTFPLSPSIIECSRFCHHASLKANHLRHHVSSAFTSRVAWLVWQHSRHYLTSVLVMTLRGVTSTSASSLCMCCRSVSERWPRR